MRGIIKKLLIVDKFSLRNTYRILKFLAMKLAVSIYDLNGRNAHAIHEDPIQPEVDDDMFQKLNPAHLPKWGI